MKKDYTSFRDAYRDYQFYEFYEVIEGDKDLEIVEYMFFNNVDVEEAVQAILGYSFPTIFS